MVTKQVVNKTNDAIHWIVTYPGVSFIHYSNNLGQEFKF